MLPRPEEPISYVFIVVIKKVTTRTRGTRAKATKLLPELFLTRSLHQTARYGSYKPRGNWCFIKNTYIYIYLCVCVCVCLLYIYICVCVCHTLVLRVFQKKQGRQARYTYLTQRSSGVSRDGWTDHPPVPASTVEQAVPILLF